MQRKFKEVDDKNDLSNDLLPRCTNLLDLPGVSNWQETNIKRLFKMIKKHNLELYQL